MATEVVIERRKTAKEIFDEVRRILDGFAVAAKIEPLAASSPPYIIAWECWEREFIVASIKGDELEMVDWVFNSECLRRCKQIVGLALKTYVKDRGHAKETTVTD